MHRRVTSGALGAVLASVALLWGVAAEAQLPSVIAISARTAQVDDLLRQGGDLERQRRWGEALTHYEEALRRFPGETALQRHFDTARVRYDLERRYVDASFVQALRQMTAAEALELYAQVLLKIDAHYVDAPHWNGLVDRGTTNLEIAFDETPFLERNSRGFDMVAGQALIRELRQAAAPPLADRTAARQWVAGAAAAAEQRLGLPQAAVIFEYLCGATNALDQYSCFLTPDQLGEVYSQIEGNFVGLGIELRNERGALLLVRVIPGSPAQEAGLRAGERIVAIDGRPVAGVGTDQAANLLQGPEGTWVRLAVAGADGAARQLDVRRRRVEVPSVDEARIVEASAGVAYLRLTCFQKTTPRDLDEALWKLHRAGMRSLIVDVRGNPGGLLTTAVEVADRFLDRGVIVSTHGRSLQEDFTYSAQAEGTWNVPLVVIIDQESASAAEIFAGAIRDHRRGTIVGARSFGKGSVQGIFPLEAGSAGLRLTTAKFYSPAGKPFSGVGVEPTVQVHVAAKPVAPAPTATPAALAGTPSATAAPAGAQGPAPAAADSMLDAAIGIARGAGQALSARQ